MNEATLQYVRQHADDDVRMLALRGSKEPEVDLTWALQQIQGRQTARRKLPSWAQTEGVEYPVHLSMEQCSSEQTARYKAALCRRLLESAGKAGTEATRLVDLTGGFGVDIAWMGEVFGHATYVERNETLLNVARHNFETLGKRVDCICADATAVLPSMEHVTMFYLDPARRNEHGGRTYGICDCTPDVLALRDELLARADFVLLKLSPMLDWRKAVTDLGASCVCQVHIVAVGGECKELLLVLSANSADHLLLCCTNDDDRFEMTLDPSASVKNLSPDGPLAAGQFLYEPNAAIMKAGCFDALATRFAVQPLAPNSHLFVSPRQVASFPGRRFRVEAVTSMNKRELRQTLGQVRQANITVRNFPLSVAELRKRLKLSEGGSHYLFATTLANGNHVLLLCQRIS